MNIPDRLERRWLSETAELRALAHRSCHRLVVEEATATQVWLGLSCTSAFRVGPGDPTVAHAVHRLALFRPDTWPGTPVQAVHQHPIGIFHPNIAPAVVDAASPADRIVAMQRLFGLFCRGVICYGQASPTTRLVDVVVQIYNMLGFRFGTFAQSGEHLNLEAGRWAQEMARAHRFPLERRPLIGDAP